MSKLTISSEANSEMKPCPFCGQQPVVKQAGKTNYWWVGCEIHLGLEHHGCGVCHSDYDKSKAIEKWNQRRNTSIEANMEKEKPMTPPTISTEARKCAETEFYPGTEECESLANQIQLAINTATQKLATENAELREQVTFWENKFMATCHTRDQLQARVKELETIANRSGCLLGDVATLTARLATIKKEGIETAQMLLMLTRHAEKVMSPNDEILNAAQQYFVKALTPPAVATNNPMPTV